MSTADEIRAAVDGINNLAELSRLAGKLSPDELRVLLEVARRLKMGQRPYGKLDLAKDRRDFTREAAEELLDCTVYLTCAVLQRDTEPCAPPPATDDIPSLTENSKPSEAAE